MSREADEATVVYLEREGLINEKEAKGLRRKIELTRKWFNKRVKVKRTGLFGVVAKVETPDLWGKEVWVRLDADPSYTSHPYGPEELEIEW